MATQKKTFVLINPRVRRNAHEAVAAAPQDYVVTVAQRTRTTEQNAKIHAMLTDISKSNMQWAGKKRSMDEWKVLMISAHAVATKSPGEVIPGIEGEYVAIRESSARMSVSRAASLIEYLHAFCATHRIELNETYRNGFCENRWPSIDEVAA